MPAFGACQHQKEKRETRRGGEREMFLFPTLPFPAQWSRYCPQAGHRAYHIGTCWPHLHLMLCRITLEPSKLPLVPLLGAAGPSLGSSKTCDPLDDWCGSGGWCDVCRREIASRCSVSFTGISE